MQDTRPHTGIHVILLNKIVTDCSQEHKVLVYHAIARTSFLTAMPF